MIVEALMCAGLGSAFVVGAVAMRGTKSKRQELTQYHSRRGGPRARGRAWRSISERTGVSSDGSGFWGGYHSRNRGRWR